MRIGARFRVPPSLPHGQFELHNVPVSWSA